MTSIDQAAEEYSNVNSNYRTKLEIKTDFKAGVQWRDEHIKKLVEVVKKVQKRMDGPASPAMNKYCYIILDEALSAFKTKEKL